MFSASSAVLSAPKIASLSSWLSLLYAVGVPLSIVSSVIVCPIWRDALPRSSSSASGFFFCGMSEEPVAYASAILTKANSCVFQMIRSSANLLRCTCTERGRVGLGLGLG